MQKLEPMLVFVCDWQEVSRKMGKMLKAHGLKLVVKKYYQGDFRDDDCRYISIEPIEDR